MVSQRDFAASCQPAVTVLAQVADGDYAPADAIFGTGKSHGDLVRLAQAMAFVAVSTTEMLDRVEGRLGEVPAGLAATVDSFRAMAVTYALDICAEGGPS